MTELRLTMNASPARRSFKQAVGQANHFLITLLVGLDHVRDGSADKSAEFSTSWNPRDVSRSVERSRAFALSATLTIVLDALQAYERNLTGNEGIFVSPATCQRIDAARKGADKRRLLYAEFGLADFPEYHLITAAAVWRNRIVHSHSKDHVDSTTVARLREHPRHFEENYQGLNVNRMLASIGTRTSAARPPTFKEATSVVRAAHRLVQELDGRILVSADLDRLLVLAVQEHENNRGSGASIWGRTPERRSSMIAQIAQNYGFSSDSLIKNAVSQETLNELLAPDAQRAKEALQRLASTTAAE